MPYLLFLKKQQNLKLSSAAKIGGALMDKHCRPLCLHYAHCVHPLAVIVRIMFAVGALGPVTC